MNTARPSSGTPRERRQQARRQQIMDVALQIAQQDGWAAVTTRRVAEAIDYRQPVIYQHFRSREELIDEIALSGFVALTAQTDELAETTDAGDRHLLVELGRRYLAFGAQHPQLYEAMFSRPTALQFAAADTPAQLRDSFISLRHVVARHVGEAGADEAAELLWAAWHGLVCLRSAGRIPEDRIASHLARLARLWD